MAEQQPPKSLVPPEVCETLDAVSRLLHQAQHLGPEAQQQLADLVDELNRTLSATAVAPEELSHLRESAAHLAEALEHQHDEGLLAAARDRLEEAAAGLEARAPTLAGITRRFLDVLSNLGI